MIYTHNHHEWYRTNSITNTKGTGERWWIGKIDYKWKEVARGGRRSEANNNEKDVTTATGGIERAKHEEGTEADWNPEKESIYIGWSAWVRGEI